MKDNDDAAYLRSFVANQCNDPRISQIELRLLNLERQHQQSETQLVHLITAFTEAVKNLRSSINWTGFWVFVVSIILSTTVYKIYFR